MLLICLQTRQSEYVKIFLEGGRLSSPSITPCIIKYKLNKKRNAQHFPKY